MLMVSPAYAGMIPPSLLECFHRTREPRIRGDDPDLGSEPPTAEQ